MQQAASTGSAPSEATTKLTRALLACGGVAALSTSSWRCSNCSFARDLTSRVTCSACSPTGTGMDSDHPTSR